MMLSPTTTGTKVVEAVNLRAPPVTIPGEPVDHDATRSDLKLWRKSLILFVVSWTALSATFASTSLLSATPEIAADFSTTVEILNVTNAFVLITMGVSSLIWSPVEKIFSRRKAYNSALCFMCVCSIGTALSPNMATFIAMRLLVGFTGTYFLVAGQTIVADIFEPVSRGRATGFFLVGTVSGPVLGPCIGGIIVTFSKWRAIYWVQVGMSGLSFLFSVLLVPDVTHKVEQLQGEKGQVGTSRLVILGYFNPSWVFRQYLVPKIVLADFACGFLSTAQYGLLTSVRHIVNPRFHLDTPLISGLFYISPGLGFIVGSLIGGRFSDRTVKRYIKKRDGLRLPQDRLNSGLWGLFLILPISMLLYGWGLQKKIGGLALPIVAAFWLGFGLMGTFNALNTYTAEVCPNRRSEVVCSKYIVQYAFAAGSSAAVVPLIDAIGCGWSFTFFVALNTIGGLFVLIIARPELFSAVTLRRLRETNHPTQRP